MLGKRNSSNFLMEWLDDRNWVAASVTSSYVKFFWRTCLLCKDVFWLCSLFACFHYYTARNALEVLVCLLLQHKAFYFLTSARPNIREITK